MSRSGSNPSPHSHSQQRPSTPHPQLRRFSSTIQFPSPSPTSGTNQRLSPSFNSPRLSPYHGQKQLVDVEQEINPALLKNIKSVRSSQSHLNTSSINKAFDAQKLPKEGEPCSEKHTKLWKAKSSPSLLIASCELIGQEGMRLFSPAQKIKTRLWLNGDKLGILSEMIDNFDPLPKKNLHSSFLSTMGSSTLLAKFFDETDLKEEHLDANTGKKIDGDWMLSLVSNKDLFSKDSQITREEIRDLPYTHKLNVNQWLDQVEKGKRKKLDKNLRYYEFSNNPLFRQGVNQAILSILMTPDETFHDFVGAYLNNEATKKLIADTLIDRKKQLCAAALQEESFKAYLASTESNNYLLNQHLQQLRTFVICAKQQFISDQAYPALKKGIIEEFTKLRGLGKRNSLVAAAATTERKEREYKK